MVGLPPLRTNTALAPEQHAFILTRTATDLLRSPQEK